MAIETKEEFKDYCLRKLGQPVITINVAGEQVDDRVEDALQLYQEYHYDATEKVYLTHQVTQEDIDNGYIDVPTDIINVVGILPVGENDNYNFLDPRYHAMRDMAHGLWSSLDITDYSIRQSFYSLMKSEITSQPGITYVRHLNRVRIHDNWSSAFVAGASYVVVEAIQVVDPESVWNDRWLKQYATALIKRQWGENLKKLKGVQLIGGVTLDGEELFREAVEEIDKLEVQLKEEYMEPPKFFWG